MSHNGIRTRNIRMANWYQTVFSFETQEVIYKSEK
jgi:hypothetical protein